VVIVDSRAGGAGGIGDQARAAGVTVFTGHVVSDVIGRSRVRGVRIASWSGNPSETVESTIKIDCDLLAVSGGWNPGPALLRARRANPGECLGGRMQRQA
jgi:sarcosine oxidase subunit alpha